jgi:nitric oxide reductase NorD protein
MSLPPPSSDPRLAALAAEPLSAPELEVRLDELLDAVLSTRRTATHLAEAVTGLLRSEQDFVLHWTGVVARTNPEMAYQFVVAAPAALQRLGLAAAEAWIVQAMDTYDREGLYRGSAVLKNLDEFAELASGSTNAQTFDGAVQVLQLFLCGLSGRRMRFDTAAHPYTDTETIYLPPRLATLPAQEENFQVYKAMAALLWAQARYGTFNLDLTAALSGFASPQRALELFNYLETVRLEAQIGLTLPGLARDMRSLRANHGSADPRLQRLRDPDARAEDSLAVLRQLYESFTPSRCCYTVELRWDQAMAVRSARIRKEKAQFRAGLTQLLDQHDAGAEDGNAVARFAVTPAAPDSGDQSSVALMLDGKPVAPPENLQQLMDSIRQDLGDFPDDYLLPADDGAYHEGTRPDNDPADAWKGVYHDEAAFFYNEWDCRRRHYRKNWCVLRELDVDPAGPEFVDATLVKYGPQVAQLKRTFEMLRGEDRLLKRQPEGNDIDFDAVISAYADMRSGLELSDRLLTRRHKAERDMAVMFMVDMSGSTKGWINDAEREALVMLCEALQVLGDRYAIYGFSGITRKRCEIFRIKRFDDPYDERVRGRIAGIRPQDYTRMGAAIRHLTGVLNHVEARTKLLVTLSDGKPDDYSDNYRGEYGIEDTRQALIEAHRSGIKPFCITIDREARDYLPHLYGPVNWTLVDEVARLPLKVAEIYRRLTS